MKKKIKLIHRGEMSLTGYELYAIPLAPGESYSLCTDTWRVYIGLSGDFRQVIDALLHELGELWLMANGCRWHDTKYNISDSKASNILIVMRHDQFDEMVKQQAYQLLTIMPKISIMYGKNKENKND